MDATLPLPSIGESVEEWLELRRAERDERRRERLHLLWLLASGAAADRLSAARQLGRNRETVSPWLADYARGGLAMVLRAPKPPGPPNRGGIGLPADAQDAIRARLAGSQGERGYLALWHWARGALHLLQLRNFPRWLHVHLGASLKVARKSHV